MTFIPVILTIKSYVRLKRQKICEHFHLPVQSGSNKILKLMNRGYTREYYLELINKIKSRVEHCSITSDIIIGFPGKKTQITRIRLI